MHVTDDRILESANAPALGSFSLSAVTGYRRWQEARRSNGDLIKIGDTAPYFAEAVDGSGVPAGAWESGIGTYTAANTIERTMVLRSSNSNAKVNFASGTVRVALGPITHDLRRTVQPSMLTVVCGNSIAGYSAIDTANNVWRFDGQVFVTSMLTGDALRFPRLLAATTRTDVHGVYSYSGQTLATINGDIQSQWIQPIRDAGVVPDLVWAVDLLVNDIQSGATTQQCKDRINAWLRIVRATWPGVRILLGTPHPNSSNDTAGEQTVFADVKAWLQTLDNGIDLFVAVLDSYEDPANPARPLSGYTDGVHPNAKGAFANARRWASAIERMGGSWRQPCEAIHSNPALLGSSAASGTNVSGTVATGVSHGGTSNANVVMTAEQPGQKVQHTTLSSTAQLDLGLVSLGWEAVPADTWFSPFVEIEIISGAANLRTIEFEPRLRDSAGTEVFQRFLESRGSDVDPDGWRDGDILVLRRPPTISTTGLPITDINLYLRTMHKAVAASTEWRVRRCGVEFPRQAPPQSAIDGVSTQDGVGLKVGATDFLTTNTVQDPFIGAAISSGTITTAPATAAITSDHPGSVLARSSTTANSGYQFTTALDRIQLGGGERFDLVFRTAAAFTNTTVRRGFTDSITSTAPTDGVYFETSGSGALTGKCRSNSTESATATLVTLAASTWYHVRISLDGGAKRALFEVFSEAGALLASATLSSNIPVGSGRSTGAGVVATNSGTTATDLEVWDYMAVTFGRNRVLRRGRLS